MEGHDREFPRRSRRSGHASDKVLELFDLTLVRAIHAPLIDDLFSKLQERRADVRLSRPSAMQVAQWCNSVFGV
ncbi:hypothetical protein SAMN05428953_11740 [Mesorhizobium muleiense]|uniref:Uncharacterized protein n=1 Tax=Mesorhizobium muleiense TaxID=1004279 RepID=A0A1G9D276_9HYPH|nr:hypothetical protein SAMN05428953_11740 [Mesorhizobium muleiense]